MKKTVTIGTRQIHLCGSEDASVLILEPLEKDGDPEAVPSLIEEKTDVPFLYAAYPVEDWNSELSPWKADPIFGKVPFEGEAEKTLSVLEEVLRELKKDHPFDTVFLGGYSLAGLFALYASYSSDSFDGIAAVSPSVWFDGFREFAEEKECRAKQVYLSLGDREHLTKNKRMATVRDNIESITSLLKEKAYLEYNPGNHFTDPEKRTAKGFTYLLNKRAHR